MIGSLSSAFTRRCCTRQTNRKCNGGSVTERGWWRRWRAAELLLIWRTGKTFYQEKKYKQTLTSFCRLCAPSCSLWVTWCLLWMRRLKSLPRRHRKSFVAVGFWARVLVHLKSNKHTLSRGFLVTQTSQWTQMHVESKRRESRCVCRCVCAARRRVVTLWWLTDSSVAARRHECGRAACFITKDQD